MEEYSPDSTSCSLKGKENKDRHGIAEGQQEGATVVSESGHQEETEQEGEQQEVTVPEGERREPESKLLPFTVETIPEGMTPHQWKIVLRKERRALRKEEALQRRKERDKMKRERRKLEKKNQSREPRSDILTEPKAKRRKMSDTGASDLRVAIDLSYDDLMSEKDLKKVMHQCQRCYSANRRADAPLQLYFTSFTSSTRHFWDQQHTQYTNWDVHKKEEGFIELFGKENVVFLTSESPNVLQDLDASKVYVIGGLVDHNHQKGYCYQKAQELEIAHAQLPISKFIKLNCREVLAINHVFEILLEFSACRDWEKSFYTVIPPRKVVSTPSALASDSSSAATVKSGPNPALASAKTDVSGPSAVAEVSDGVLPTSTDSETALEGGDKAERNKEVVVECGDVPASADGKAVIS